jgi:sulfatase modifying factor 1
MQTSKKITLLLTLALALTRCQRRDEDPRPPGPLDTLTAAHANTAPDGFVWVQGGPFIMGSPWRELPREDWNQDERTHEVHLHHDFIIKTTEITQEEWRELLRGAHLDPWPHRFSACGPRCPAETINWFQAVAAANLWSDRHHLEPCYTRPDGLPYAWQDALDRASPAWPRGYACAGYRLPTEAEWELAARGRGPHRASRSYAGDDDRDLDAVAWHVNNSRADAWGLDCAAWAWRTSDAFDRCGPQPVAQKHPNDLGLYDMLGNVWEWTWDWHADYPHTPDDAATGPANGQRRAIRGGSWYVHPEACRAASRSHEDPSTANGNLGLRLVKTSPRAAQTTKTQGKSNE